MLTQLHGKAFTLKLDGKQRTIGEISGALITPQRTQLVVTVELTDEEVAGILGEAADKNEAAASPIGMSEAEIDAAIADAREDLGNDPGPFVHTRALPELLSEDPA